LHGLIAVVGEDRCAAAWLSLYFRQPFSNHAAIERRKNLHLRGSVTTISNSLRQARSMDEVLASLAKMGPTVDAHRVRLSLRRSDLKPDGFTATPWLPQLVCEHPTVTARVPLEMGLGHMELEWRDGRIAIDRDHEIAAERLSGPLTMAIERALKLEHEELDESAGFLPLASGARR
jgi:hypothetical protein